jgi:hypothetical protein
MIRLLAVLLLLFCGTAQAEPSQQVEVVSDYQIDGIVLVEDSIAAQVIAEPTGDPAVKRAAANLEKDIARVSANPAPRAGPMPILVGTLGQSALIDALVKEGKLDVSGVEGKWEAYVQQVVDNPMRGVQRALIVAGADRRGTVYGIYDISARIGVSPWHWWADIPVQKRRQLYLTAGRRADAPKVLYRGIFINDEEPALGTWARKKFGGVNADFYEQVFDLLLRSKANYLWPAMWGKSLWQDDAQSAQLAHDMGIILGTSHHEPMMRAHVEWERAKSGKWDYATNGKVLQRFWRDGITRSNGQDRMVTIGMRGDGDEPMSETTAINLLERIVSDQRVMIAEETGLPAEKTPQMWALYKEVQDYYDQGMQVPDDVLLLFADDNWGNIRRLPKAGQRRAGGFGVYYHFDYVGDPRNYKWLNNTQIERVWEQMSMARAHGADTLWIANVGDIKPMELPISFFLEFAWDPDQIPLEVLPHYYRRWASRQFGAAHAEDIASLLRDSSRINARRKPELIDAYYYRTDDDDEAERIASEYRDMDARAQKIAGELSPQYKSAFYQLVQHPIEAMANLHKMYRSVAEGCMHDAQLAFANDHAIRQRYEALENGKWQDMMSQTHISYTGWQQPEKDVLPDPVSWRPDRKVRSGPRAIPVKDQAMFLEDDGLIVIDAPSFTRTGATGAAEWRIIPNLGHWSGGVTLFPQSGESFTPATGPYLDYDIALGAGGEFNLAVYASPSLDVLGSGELRYAVSINDGTPVIADLMEGDANVWSTAVADNIRVAITRHHAEAAGKLRVRIWAVDRGVVIQRLIVTRGALPRSKLGPVAFKPR